MIGDVIGVGSRVKINSTFGTGNSDADQEMREFMHSVAGEEGVEEARLELIGKTGTVMCIHSHEAWPYTVLFDDLTPDGERWVVPSSEGELDVIDDLDSLAESLVKEDSK